MKWSEGSNWKGDLYLSSSKLILRWIMVYRAQEPLENKYLCRDNSRSNSCPFKTSDHNATSILFIFKLYIEIPVYFAISSPGIDSCGLWPGSDRCGRNRGDFSDHTNCSRFYFTLQPIKLFYTHYLTWFSLQPQDNLVSRPNHLSNVILQPGMPFFKYLSFKNFFLPLLKPEIFFFVFRSIHSKTPSLLPKICS